MNIITRVTRTIHFMQTHPAPTHIKVVGMPLILAMLIFDIIKDMVGFLLSIWKLMVIVILLAIILTGCSGWSWEDEQRFRAGMYEVQAASQAEVEAVRSQTWTITDQAYKQSEQARKDAQKLCVSQDGQRMIKC